MSNLRGDPTRTMMIQSRWMGDIGKRFRKIRGEIFRLVVKDNAFGLDKGVTVNQSDFTFMTDDRKLSAFQLWFSERISEGVLTVDGMGEPWTQEYVQAAYTKGARRAFTQVNQGSYAVGGASEAAAMAGAEAEFIRALSAPESISKVRLMATRSFEELRGVSSAMGQQMNRVMADALSQGWGARKTAREMNLRVAGITQKRAMLIARTETVYAHAEGQLDSFEKLGVEEIGVEAEWSTAGDDRVCPKCAAMEGKTFKPSEAHGLIPAHVNCRCAWLPSEPKQKP